MKLVEHRPGAPIESLEHFDAMRPAIPPLADGVRLSFVGDVMWVGGNWSDYALPAAPLLDGDLRIGNLETPTVPGEPIDLPTLGPYTFNAPVEMLDGLPLDVLQLDNNHSLDLGDPGLEATVAEVEARGFVHTGVDEHAVVEIAGERIALLSFTWGLNQRDATSAHELFIVPFGHVGEDIDLDPVRAAIDGVRAEVDTVVVLLHWGFEYEYFPDPHFMVLGREIVAAGADLVVGQGPHVVQPPEICFVDHGLEPGIGACAVETGGEPRTAAILYSLGNFGTVMPTVQAQVGVVATVSLDGDVTGLGWEPVVALDRGGPTVEPLADHLDDPDLAAESDRLDAHLGATWRR